MSNTDLSPYEQARLQRIKENKAQIALIGLKKLKPKQSRSTTSSKQAATIKKLEREKRKRAKTVPTKGSRRSKRLKGQASDGDALSYSIDSSEQTSMEDDEPPTVDYSEGNWPAEPATLDDFEFLIYAELRRWRLLKSRSAEIESYKIFQNRTLCEVIRRRRNDPAYATAVDTVESELLLCWGIGPSKAKESGFGRELLVELQAQAVVEWLEQSRKL